MPTLTSNLPVRRLQLEPLALDEKASVTRAVTSLSLASFAEAFYPGWEAGRFHLLLAKKLEMCLERKIRRLAISCPPQHGKSRLTSVNFPAWAMTKKPTLRMFQAGHNGDLSRGFTREARSLVASDRYLQLYPALINPNVNRQDHWETKLGGYYHATSVGGGTGVPADILLLDDPHRDRAEARNPTTREKVWEWICSVAVPRLAPDGVMIVIQTRWHEDDCIGRLTDPKRVKMFEEAGYPEMNFEVVSLEALCENPKKDLLRRKVGEALWPEKRTAKMLEATRLEIGPAEWNALYQQRPAPPSGMLVDGRLIKSITRDQVPPGLRLIRAWDLALSADSSGDFSCGAYGGMDSDGNFYLVHMNRGQRKWPEQKAEIIACAELESIGSYIGIETVSAWLIAQAELQDALRGRVTIRGYNPDKDKQARAEPWFGKIRTGKFFMVRGTWNQEFLDELEQFPQGKHDDQIDAVTVLWVMLYRKQDSLIA